MYNKNHLHTVNTVKKEKTTLAMLVKIIFLFIMSVALFSCSVLNRESGANSRFMRGSDIETKLIPIERPRTPEEVRNITLLLPLSGNWAAVGTVVRNGFLAAYYYQQTQKQNAVNIKVIDTNGKDIIEVYRAAVADKAEVIVGPLTKQEIEVLAATNRTLPVPTLALNTLNDYKRYAVVNLYQFGLLPQDEVQQAAIKMLQEGHRDVAIIMPANEWGRNIAATLRREMTRQGGNVIATLEYAGAQDDFDLKIQQLLQIDNVGANGRDLRQKKTPLYYHDAIKAVFLLAEPNIARQIVPLLRFYTNNNLPVYATSHVYGGFVRTELDQDLEGINFCDVPWAVTNAADLDTWQQEIRNKINTLWPNSLRNNARLYALGVDAYNVATSLNTLLAAPHTSFSGATGELTLDDYNHIYRQLHWTTMRHGVPLGL